MELLKASRRKNLFSEVLHILLNIVLAAAVLGLVVGGSASLAFLLVIVSKWRILAVRPRYWWANIQANIVDISVSLGSVVLMTLAGTASGQYALYAQITLAVVWAIWLIFIKPRSGSQWVALQAATSLFIGSWALLSVAHTVSAAVVAASLYIVAYGSAKHVVSARSEDQPTLVAMVFGFLIAEIGWIVYHWTVAYGVANLGDLKVAQGAIVIVLTGLLAERMYYLYMSGRAVRSAEVAIPTVFVVATIAILTIVFKAGAGIV